MIYGKGKNNRGGSDDAVIGTPRGKDLVWLSRW
jgi:hypothetical protein